MREFSLGAVLIVALLLFGGVPSWAAMFLVGSIFFISSFLLNSFCSSFRPLQIAFCAVAVLAFFQIFFFSHNPFASSTEILKWLSLGCFFCMAQDMTEPSLRRLSFLILGMDMKDH